jgi:N6-adenosine-specific RNA methylase IME4
LILADPLWRYHDLRSPCRAIENHYPTMSLERICALPVPEIAARDAVLFLWATSPTLPEALQVLSAWGFSYKSSVVWVKDGLGMGYYARINHELLLIGVRGSPGVPAPAHRPASVIQAPRRRHSEKPGIVHGIIETMYPDAVRIELFCRRTRAGWVAWGNEVAGGC